MVAQAKPTIFLHENVPSFPIDVLAAIAGNLRVWVSSGVRGCESVAACTLEAAMRCIGKPLTPGKWDFLWHVVDSTPFVFFHRPQGHMDARLRKTDRCSEF